MREPRSIIFYSWFALAVEVVILAGVIAFVLVGAAYQSKAITDLHQKAQSAQLANVILEGNFADAERALRGYQATGQGRFLQSYYGEQDEFVLTLTQLRRLAWQAALNGVIAEERRAQAAFLIGASALTARPGSNRAIDLFDQTSASADAFDRANSQLRARLGRESDALALTSERTLGIGLAGTGAILAAGLMLPVTAAAFALRWASRPLRDVTMTLRKRALGDLDARAVPGGPADVRDLATSINSMADQSERLRLADEERSRLLAVVRQVSIRIREHLHAQDIVRDGVAAIKQEMAADSAWVRLIRDDQATPAEGVHYAQYEAADAVSELPVEFVTWLRDLYQRRSGYCIQDLHSSEAEQIPPRILKGLLGLGATSMLITPFGTGSELLGELALLRNDPAKPWTEVEIAAVESLAEDMGRGLEHARLYEGEERIVADLKTLDLAKDGFLSAASHDLRTPLASIAGYVELLEDREAGPLTQEQATMLDAVSRNTRRLQNLIEDMLTISKIEFGGFTSDLRPMDLASLVPGAVDLLHRSPEDNGLVFDVSTPEHSLMVDGDARQLDRVLMNLLSNAVKYTPSGGHVTLTAGRRGTDAVIEVRDTGMGIPDQEQPSLFTRFFRASNALERAIQGSGLGLSIVRTIVENHHGDIEVTSKEGVGTTVTVRIPLLDGGSPR